MNAQLPCRQARQTLFAIRQIRYGSTRAKGGTKLNNDAAVERKNTKEDKPNYKTYGSRIWVYVHLQRNHMVYSLTKSMRNNFSLRQLPFNGKKTVPPALRKDLWHPFCNISFEASPAAKSTSPAIGLSCYQKLREFRRRHELEWEQSDYTNAEGEFVGRDKIPYLLCDQKANSVADMAYVFDRLGLRENIAGEEGEESIGLIGDGTGSNVRIEWWDLRDAEFAETWSDNVEHVAMGGSLQTNNREEGKLWGRGKQRAQERAAAESEAAAEEQVETA